VDAAKRDDSPERETRILGDLLYADGAKIPVAEKDWVALVQRVATGDQHALQALYERTHRIAFTLIVRIVNNRETAEEVTVDLYHDLWRRASTYDVAGGSVVGWIMNQARSRAIDRLRFEQRKKRVSASAENPLPGPAPDDPRELVATREESRRLRDALRLLTPDERQAIETAFFSEMTYPEVATRLNQPLGTIKTRVRSGLGKLRDALGGSAEDR